MLRQSLLIILLAPALFLGACQTSPRAGSASPADATAVARDEGYALLYSTISDECDVDKVLIIKRPAAQVADLIKAIGQHSRDAKTSLENLAKEEPRVVLKDQGLPDAETKAREAISSATSKQILFSGGKELEFRLLLTQHQALNYIAHLAATLADQEPRDNRKRFLTQLSKQSATLHDQVVAQMMTPYAGHPK